MAGIIGSPGGSAGSGSGGGGDASATNQLTAIAALGDILSEVTGVAKDVSIGQVLTAIQDLGDGSTIDNVVTALVSDATTQGQILAKLTDIGVDTSASAASLVTIATQTTAINANTDGVEGLLGDIKTGTDKIPASPAQDRPNANAPHATRASNGTSFIDVALDTTVSAVTTAVNAAKGVLDTIFARQADGSQKTKVTNGTNDAAVVNSAPTTEYGVVTRNIPSGTQTISGSVTADTELPAAAALADNTANPTVPGVGAFQMLWDAAGSIWRRAASDTSGRTVVAGNVANGATAPKPVTTGGVDTSGNSYPVEGQISGTGQGIHLFVRQGGGVAWTVDSELPAASALADNTSNPTAPAVGSFPHHWDPGASLWRLSHGSVNGSQVVAFDRSHLGPFGHLIAQPLTFVSQITFTYGINATLGTTASSGTGAAVDTNAGLLRVQCGTSSSGSASYLSSRPLLYRAGQGMGMLWSCAFTTGVASNTTFAGASTDASGSDGYFFGYKGTSFGIHHYRSGSEVSFTAQASWNGNVPTGFDPTKLNLYEVRYPFLGAGDIFFYIEDPTSGRMVLVHTIRYANSSTTLQISNPTLKFLVRSVNTGGTTNLTTLVGSIGKFIVGGRHFNGPPFAVHNQKAVTGGTETNVLSLRVATTLNGVTNRGAARIRLTTGVGDNGNTITAFLVRNGATLGGSPSFSPLSGSTADNGVTLTSANSMVSIDTAGTTATSGTVVYSSGCARNSEFILPVEDYDFVVLPGETWTFSATPGANANCAFFVSGIEEW